jgi:hypothetical protein
MLDLTHVEVIRDTPDPALAPISSPTVAAIRKPPQADATR